MNHAKSPEAQIAAKLLTAMKNGQLEECMMLVSAGASWAPPEIEQVHFMFRRNLYRVYRDVSIRLHDLWGPMLRQYLEFDSVNITLEYLGCQHESRQQEQRREEETKRLIAWRLRQLPSKDVIAEDID